jgi:hypothetical protein
VENHSSHPSHNSQFVTGPENPGGENRPAGMQFPANWSIFARFMEYTVSIRDNLFGRKGLKKPQNGKMR